MCASERLLILQSIDKKEYFELKDEFVQNFVQNRKRFALEQTDYNLITPFRNDTTSLNDLFSLLQISLLFYCEKNVLLCAITCTVRSTKVRYGKEARDSLPMTKRMVTGTAARTIVIRSMFIKLV